MENTKQQRGEVEGTCDLDELIKRAKDTENQIWQSLEWPWRRLIHPVTAMHLEQIASHIHSILFYLKPQNNPLANDELGRASLCSLLDQLDRPWGLWRLTRDSAWELAGEFERQLIELGDDTYLYTLLKDQTGSGGEEDGYREIKRVPTIAIWDKHFSSDDLTLLRLNYEYSSNSFDERLRDEVRYALRHLHLVRSEEYRRDRTKMRLRARYLAWMTPLIIVLLLLLCGSYLLISSPNTYGFTSLIPPSLSEPIQLLTREGILLPAAEQPWPFPAYMLLFVFSSGGLGGIFGRAYRLGRKSLRLEAAPPTDESFSGIRAHLAEGKSLLAQIAMGGTSAIIIYLVLQLFSPDLAPVGYGVVGFLAGYSEPFFSRMLQETAGVGQRYSGL